MSHGLYLLRAMIDAGARAEFRQAHDGLFTDTERPAYHFVRRFYQAHGHFPTPEAAVENGFVLPAGGNPVSYYMDRCQTRAIYNSISTTFEPLGAAMQARDMDEAVRIVQSLNRSVGALQTTQDTATLVDLMAEVMVDYEHAHQHPGMQGVPLGWGYLDELTGGAEGGDVVTFAARPGMGKSWLLSHIATRAWLTGTSVLFVSMEMTRRILSMLAGVNPDPIRRGQLSQWSRDVVYQQLDTARAGVPFHMLTGSFDKSVPLVDAAIQEFSPGLVCIDASYLMDPSTKGMKKSFELLTDVAKEIKTMAMSRNKPIIQTVQFNREAEKSKKRNSSHIGGTDAVGQITTIGIGIKEGRTGRESSSRTLEIFKNREGEDSASFDVNFLFRPPNFDFIPRIGEDGEPTEDHENVETAGGI
jgi:replicative DNA helicase